MNEGRHIIVNKQEWTMIINGLDILWTIVQDKPIEPELLSDLKWHFKPDKLEELSDRICKIK